MRSALDAFLAVERAETVAIAAVNGIAYGGGTELTLCCDMALASDGARFAFKEVTLGLMPGYGLVRGPEVIGRAWTHRLTLTGDTIDAAARARDRARPGGLPADTLVEDALALAARIAAHPPDALRTAKRFINRHAPRRPRRVDRGDRAADGEPRAAAALARVRVAMTEVLTFEEHDVQEEFFARGWTDGLPIVAPTPERVQAMVDLVGGDALIGYLAARGRGVTIEQAAINAVMAGCRPDYFPVVVAALEAMFDPAFNLHTVLDEHRRRGAVRDRERPDRGRDRHERAPQRARPGQPRERDDRPRAAARRHERARLEAGGERRVLVRASRQAHALLRRGLRRRRRGSRCGSSSATTRPTRR